MVAVIRTAWTLLIVAAGVLVLAQPGLAAPQPPPGWLPRPVASSVNCFDLAGTYHALGEGVQDSSRSWRGTDLANLVFHPQFVSGATHVSLVPAGPDSIRFTAWRDTTRLKDRTLWLGARSTECRDGALHLRSGRVGNDAVVGVSRRQPTLHRGSDSTLVVALKITDRGLAFLMIPMWTTQMEWYRFRHR